jgi:hypothetical protein
LVKRLTLVGRCFPGLALKSPHWKPRGRHAKVSRRQRGSRSDRECVSPAGMSCGVVRPQIELLRLRHRWHFDTAAFELACAFGAQTRSLAVQNKRVAPPRRRRRLHARPLDVRDVISSSLPRAVVRHDPPRRRPAAASLALSPFPARLAERASDGVSAFLLTSALLAQVVAHFYGPHPHCSHRPTEVLLSTVAHLVAVSYRTHGVVGPARLITQMVIGCD